MDDRSAIRTTKSGKKKKRQSKAKRNIFVSISIYQTSIMNPLEIRAAMYHRTEWE